MRLRVRLVATLALALIIGPTQIAFAQDLGGLVIDSVDTSQYPNVSIIASIPRDQLAADIPSSELKEDGVSLDANVQLEASDGLEIVLLLDVSGSMKGEPLAAAKQAAKDFVSVMPDSVDVAVIAFGSAPVLASEFTNDRNSLLASIDQLDASGETALYDGVVAATDLLGASSQTLKTIVMVSDGGDTVSSSNLDNAAAAMKDVGASLYSIELQSPENDRDALDTLALAVGGSVFSAEGSDLGTVFGSITAQLLTRFRVTYVSQSEGDTEITLALQTTSGISSANQVVTLPTITPVLEEIDPSQVETPPSPAVRAGEIVALSWWDTEQALWVGVGALFLAIASTLSMMSLPKPAENVLRADPHRLGEFRPSALSTLASSATNLAETTLTKADRLTPLNAALEQAGLAMRPAEFVVLILSGTVIAGAVGMLLAGPAVALASSAMVLAVAKLRLGSKASERSRAFGDQLVDSLQLMASSMRAGYGLLQAIDSVAAEAPSPSSEEFQRIKVETQLGREVEDSMRAAADRVQSEDFRMVAESIEIHRQIGGDLAEILDAVNETIRDRNRIRRRIRALSAEGRISGIVLSVIPIVLVIAISFLNPSYLGELTGSPIGRLIIGLGVVAWLIAVVWIRRLVRLVF